MRLPDFEAWAIFAKVVQTGSFSQAGAELGLSKATVSKAVARLEARLGAQLIQRTSRRVVLSDIGRHTLARAERMLAEAEAADFEASTQSAQPRGRVRVTAPVQFGLEHIAPLLPGLLTTYPDLSLDLHFSDQVVDLIGEGFDLAVRIGKLADSSLRARRLCGVQARLVGAPAYFAQFGRPTHPRDLAQHRCLTYAYQSDPNRWRFTSTGGEEIAVVPQGPLRTNSGEAFLPMLRAGCGITVLPEFIVWKDLEAGLIEAALADWSLPAASLNLVTPPGGPRPVRVQVVIDLLARHLSSAPWARRLPAASLHEDPIAS